MAHAEEAHENIVMKEPVPGEKPGGPQNFGFDGGLGPPGAPVTTQPLPNQAQMSAVPRGLEYLSTLNRVNIHQVLHIEEVFLNWERNNRYQICNEQTQEFLNAKEDTDCCTRQWCGNIRPFDILISDMQNQPVVKLSRDLHCQGCCCPCCLQQMDIFYPFDQKVATIKEKWTCLVPIYEIVDINGSIIFKIEGPGCWFACCQDIIFNITRPDGSDAGQIVKHWNGCAEIFTMTNNFSVSYIAGEHPVNKAILLGATFLIDFMYFERKNK